MKCYTIHTTIRNNSSICMYSSVLKSLKHFFQLILCRHSFQIEKSLHCQKSRSLKKRVCVTDSFSGVPMLHIFTINFMLLFCSWVKKKFFHFLTNARRILFLTIKMWNWNVFHNVQIFFNIKTWCIPSKQTSLGESLAKSRAYNLIRDSRETLGEREKSRQVPCRESHQESSRDSLRDFWRDSWRDFSCSPNVSPESRIGLYAWLSANLSPRLAFLRGITWTL